MKDLGSLKYFFMVKVVEGLHKGLHKIDLSDARTTRYSIGSPGPTHVLFKNSITDI